MIKYDTLKYLTVLIKNTDEMQQEILSADNIYDMLDKNHESFRFEEISEYLQKLIEKKNIKEI